MRVVSLACSNTEIVCALGLAERLVAVDDHSDTPPQVVARLPRVGPDLSPDIEAIAALEPDLVLATLTVPGHERVIAALDRAGLPFLAPAPTSLDTTLDSVRDIADALDAGERGRRLVSELRAAFGPDPGPPSEDAPRILIQWWPRPVIAAGRRSWTSDLLSRAGALNALDEDTISRPLADEQVRRLAPDAIVISWCGVETAKLRPEVVSRNPAFVDVAAVRSGRVHAVPEAWLGRPSPMLLRGLDALRGIVASFRVAHPLASDPRASLPTSTPGDRP